MLRQDTQRSFNLRIKPLRPLISTDCDFRTSSTTSVCISEISGYGFFGLTLRMKTGLFILSLLWGLVFQSQAEEVNYNRDIRPILSNKCFLCHGGDEESREADLRLDNRDGAIEKHDGRSAVRPGDVANSEMMIRVLSEDVDEVMPPKGKPLSEDEKDKLKKWIEQGAKYDRHWAYVKPKQSALPVVRNKGWPRNAIDHFVLAKIESEGMRPSDEARPAILLRRLYLDLTGLPPSVEQVEAFAADPSEQAYQAEVDDLLASSRFGERWARPWLDLARYADSNGYQHDEMRTIWPYRDWVIRALNADMPFDQFSIEQLAGDLLPNSTRAQKIATGFLRAVATNLAGGTKFDEVRAAVLSDRVTTTGTVWLGETLLCAQCHTHKFDPITTNEYYQLYAFFNNDVREVVPNPTGRKTYQGAGIELPVSARRKAEFEGLIQVVEKNGAQLEAAKAQALQQLETWFSKQQGAKKPMAALTRVIDTPFAKMNEKQRERLEKAFFSSKKPILKLIEEQKKLEKQLAEVRPPLTLVMASAEKERETHVFLRGNLITPGEEVFPATPLALHPMKEGLPKNRLGLARWLVDADNPLVGRVTVNRWWAEIFGKGLVASTEDFGLQGTWPTHPQLLDWLAVEFVEQGWSMKQMLRLMVTSSTYRQSSDSTEVDRNKDVPNQFYARGSRVRMDAEMVRDNALKISGLLSERIGGAPVRPEQPDGLWSMIVGVKDPEYRTSTGTQRYRRGIYVVRRRGAMYPSFTTFDASDRADCKTQQVRTNTPLQALVLLNDPVYLEAAAALARRMVQHEPSSKPAERAAYGFKLCVAREANQVELAAMLNLYQGKRSEFQRQPNLVKALKVEGLDGDPDLAAWFYVAHTLLNLDETIIKR